MIFPCLLTRGLYNSSKCTKWLAYEQRRKEVWNRWPSSCLTPETILESFWFHKNRRISGFVLTSLLLSTKILLCYFWNQNNDTNILSGVDFGSCESHLTSIEARTDTDPWICSLCCCPYEILLLRNVFMCITWILPSSKVLLLFKERTLLSGVLINNF